MSGPSAKRKKLSEELDIDMKFNKDFEPSKSSRNATKTVYDGSGRIRSSGKDVCDCLRDSCCGCHFPCSKCKSSKCGIECRNNRNDYTTYIESDDGKCEKRFNNNFSS